MTAEHGPDHLGPAGFCNCGRVDCCLSDAGDCLCGECACQETRPAPRLQPGVTVPPTLPFAGYVPPITATHYLGEPAGEQIPVDYVLYGEPWDEPPHGTARLGTTGLQAAVGSHAGQDVEVHYQVDGYNMIERHKVMGCAPGWVYLEKPLGTGLAQMCLTDNPPPLREETYAALRRIIPPGRAPDDREETPYRFVGMAHRAILNAYGLPDPGDTPPEPRYEGILSGLSPDPDPPAPQPVIEPAEIRIEGEQARGFLRMLAAALRPGHNED